MSRVPYTAQAGYFDLLLISLVLMLLVTPLWAVEMKGLYEVEVPVEGQSAEQRRAAIREAFSQILVKVTGSRELDKPILRYASRYVQQYRYRTLERKIVEVPTMEAQVEHDGLITNSSLEDSAELRIDPEVQTEPERLLWVRFDAAAVNRMLREKGLVIWGSARPSILLWLSQEQQGERVMLQPEMFPEMVAVIEEQARQRGLAVMLPLMDMEDYQQLPVSALWGGFAEIIQHASSRYGVEVILTGQLVAVEAQWQVEWRLYQDEWVERWMGPNGTLNEMVAQGIEQMSDRLAERYTQSTADDRVSQLYVDIRGVDDLADYAKIEAYFESLVMVEQAVLLTIEHNRAEFLLNFQGGEEALIQGIKLGRVLEKLEDEAIPEVVDVVDEELEGPFLPAPPVRESATFRLR